MIGAQRFSRQQNHLHGTHQRGIAEEVHEESHAFCDGCESKLELKTPLWVRLLIPPSFFLPDSSFEEGVSEEVREENHVFCDGS